MDQFQRVLTLLYVAGVTFNLEKFEFFTNCIIHLGHVLRSGRLEVLTRTIGTTWRPQQRTTVTESQSLLGLCDDFRSVMLRFARVACSGITIFLKVICRLLMYFQTKTLLRWRSENLNEESFRVGSSTFPRRLYCQTRRLQHAYRLCPSTNQFERADNPGWYGSRSLNDTKCLYNTTQCKSHAVVLTVFFLQPFL